MPTARGINLREVEPPCCQRPLHADRPQSVQVVRHSLGVTEGDVEGQALVDDMLSVHLFLPLFFL